jgi:hypothetical protein
MFKSQNHQPVGRFIMTKSSLLSALVGALFVAGLAIAPAHAQATRTWVSGVGDDANPCSRTAPCKTFAGAISKTSALGEINTLDPGGFGALTITKAISIYNDGVGEAGVLVSGTNGINISAATTDIVNLRGLIFDGLNASTAGVQVNTASKVTIMNCVIQEFTTAVNITPSSGTVFVKIQDSTLLNNSAGVISKPTGGAIVNVEIDRARMDSNSGGAMKIDGTGGGSSNVAVNDSSMSQNGGTGTNGVSGASGNIKIDLMRDTIANNVGAGVQANISGGGTSTVTVGQSMLSNNGSAWQALNGASLLTFQNNQVTGAAGTGPSGNIGPQ